MKVINNPLAKAAKILGEQLVSINEYRPFKYLFYLKKGNGLIVLNTLTYEMLYLNADEKKVLDNPNDFLNTTAFDVLVKKWFLVPSSFDECNLLNQLITILKLTEKTHGTYKLNRFKIFPTTDCNARCFYCFENNVKRISMSAQTALDVGEFITKACQGDAVKIGWFGGEPLYNKQAIDIISKTLLRNNVEYSSSIITNGYLFDKYNIKDAKNLWNLRSVQITLDGTEKIYNRIKNYIYNTIESPFNRVISNIKLLLDEDFFVIIRLNLGKHNSEDLSSLVSYLITEFAASSNLSIAISLLYKNTSSTQSYTQAEYIDLLNKKYALEKHLKRNKLFKLADFNKSCFYGRCMADNPNATIILPDGNLGKCEHYLESDFWGNIYSDRVDRSVIDAFKEIAPPCTNDSDCAFFPFCHILKKCPSSDTVCDDLRKYKIVEDLKRICLEKYDSYFSI